MLLMKLNIALGVTCLDADGAEIADPAPGSPERAELRDSVEEAVRTVLAHAEANGFPHRLEATTSIIVGAVGAPDIS